jgi:hypothetical protein
MFAQHLLVAASARLKMPRGGRIRYRRDGHFSPSGPTIRHLHLLVRSAHATSQRLCNPHADDRRRLAWDLRLSSGVARELRHAITSSGDPAGPRDCRAQRSRHHSWCGTEIASRHEARCVAPDVRGNRALVVFVMPCLRGESPRHPRTGRAAERHRGVFWASSLHEARSHEAVRQHSGGVGVRVEDGYRLD